MHVKRGAIFYKCCVVVMRPISGPKFFLRNFNQLVFSFFLWAKFSLGKNQTPLLAKTF